MIRIAVLVCALALSVTAAHGEPAKPTGPVWKRKPGPDVLLSVMPKRAVERGVRGTATMTCSVTMLGLLKDCAVVSESPADYGFGAAAVAMAPFFQLNPPPADGKPVEDGTVTIPIVWELQHSGGGPASGRSLLVSPPWAVAPSWAQMNAAWPAKAGAAAEGFVTLRCTLSGEGAPTYCSEVSEAPERLGFEDAAKELAKTFRLSFSAAEQLTLKTLVVDIPFHFRNPGQGDPRKLTTPRWVRTLSPAAMATLYPMAARSAGVFTGRGWVRCKTTATGDLADCAVSQEDPAGLGFGPAALEAAKILRMNPWTADGEPVDGRDINMPIRFTWDDAVPADK